MNSGIDISLLHEKFLWFNAASHRQSTCIMFNTNGRLYSNGLIEFWFDIQRNRSDSRFRWGFFNYTLLPCLMGFIIPAFTSTNIVAFVNCPVRSVQMWPDIWRNAITETTMPVFNCSMKHTQKINGAVASNRTSNEIYSLRSYLCK